MWPFWRGYQASDLYRVHVVYITRKRCRKSAGVGVEDLDKYTRSSCIFHYVFWRVADARLDSERWLVFRYSLRTGRDIFSIPFKFWSGFFACRGSGD